jgi:hypothetical protein
MEIKCIWFSEYRVEEKCWERERGCNVSKYLRRVGKLAEKVVLREEVRAQAHVNTRLFVLNKKGLASSHS